MLLKSLLDKKKEIFKGMNFKFFLLLNEGGEDEERERKRNISIMTPLVFAN